jgi:hypothetical protein
MGGRVIHMTGNANAHIDAGVGSTEPAKSGGAGFAGAGAERRGRP